MPTEPAPGAPSVFYAVKHTTRYKYSRPISESISEVRKQPRNEGTQRCLRFELSVFPRARIGAWKDHLGNIVHTFDIPRHHTSLSISGRAIVEVAAPAWAATAARSLPEFAAQGGTYAELAAAIETHDFYDMLMPSAFCWNDPELDAFAAEFEEARKAVGASGPLSDLIVLNRIVFNYFAYEPASTSVHSPIAEALAGKRGVCQDFSHVFASFARFRLRIPCRYISGYLFHRSAEDRSVADATHAWVEAYVPKLGWIGFDPTNNLLCAGRHIRAAIGRDYADVPPTRGLFKGSAESELTVAVHTAITDDVEIEPEPVSLGTYQYVDPEEADDRQQQQQQQQ